MKLISHVDCGALANIKDFAEELLELRVNDRSVNGQKTRGNLGGKCFASADEAVTIGRSCEESWVSLHVKPKKLY
jgi:hypothetical protein